jgi:hypothetical protein
LKKDENGVNCNMDSSQKNIITTNNSDYWQKVDELATLKERQNIIEAITKTDTEKFFLFIKMLRLHNTLQKIKSAN